MSKVIRETIHQLNVTMKALVNNWDELTKYVPRIFLNKEGQSDLPSSIFLSCHAVTVDASRNQKYCFYFCYLLSMLLF